MTYDNRPLPVERNEAGFWDRAEMVDRAKTTVGMGYVLAQGWASGVTVTGTTAETDLLPPILIPGGCMGVGGSLVVSAYFQATLNANSKIIQAKIGGTTISGATQNMASAAGHGFQRYFGNRGAFNQNRWFGASGVPAAFASGIAIVDTALDMSVDQFLTFTATLAVSTDSIWIAGYQVLLFPSD